MYFPLRLLALIAFISKVGSNLRFFPWTTALALIQTYGAEKGRPTQTYLTRTKLIDIYESR